MFQKVTKERSRAEVESSLQVMDFDLDELESAGSARGIVGARGIKNPFKEIKKAFKSIKSLGNSLKSVWKEVKRIDDRIEDAAQDVLREILRAAASGTLDKAVDVIQVALPSTFSLKIGPLGLELSDVKDRIDTLQRWANHPPKSDKDVKEMVRTLAPTSVSLNIDFQLALVFISSDALEVGFGMSWNTEDFLEHYDDLMKVLK